MPKAKKRNAGRVRKIISFLLINIQLKRFMKNVDVAESMRQKMRGASDFALMFFIDAPDDRIRA